jgi:pimeloyl-ACP methyl ester carboxylesterase
MSVDTTATEPLLHRIPVNGVSLAAFEWQAEQRGQGRTLFMVHATGFHGRVWDPVIARLTGRHAIAAELRGHGRSEDADFDSWEVFGCDLAGMAAALDLQGAVGVGHSMGAHALVQAAAFEPGRFSRLVLVDPVIRAPAEYHLPAMDALHPSAGRKSHFESAQAMFDRFAGRPPYAVFDPAALRAYCEHGLGPADGGAGLPLACAPRFEAKVYTLARRNRGIYASIRALQVPVLVVRARPQDPSVRPWDPLGSPTWPELASEFRHGRDLQLLDKTHLLPMEDPSLMARLIEDAMAGRE